MQAQLPSLPNQYLNNTMSVNPAFAGHNDALSTSLSYCNQWVGFTDAPVNLIFTAHAPVYNDRVGLGLMFRRTTAGIFSTTGAYGSYAYRMEMEKGILALGAGMGFTVYNVLWSRLHSTDPGDDLLTGNDNSALMPDFSLGVYYYTSKYFAGISIPEFLTHEMTSSGRFRIENRISGYTMLLMGGYFFDLGGQARLLPSTMVKVNPSHRSQVDLNAQLILKDRIWIGAGYRSSNVLVGLLQFQANYQLRMAYSYDFDLGPIGKFSSGSHEFVLSYVFSYLRKVTGPRQF